MWRKSSYSTYNGACLEWRTSTHSNSGACVEVRGSVDIRDSKDPGGRVLTFPGTAWTAFLARITAA